MKERTIPVLIGVCLTLLLTSFLFLSPLPISKVFRLLENGFYDLQLRQAYHSLPAETPIAIVDIDDQSIQDEGHWPWTRKRLANLSDKLQQLGASVVVFDILFPEEELNPAEQIIEALKKKSSSDMKETLSELEQIKPSFDYDEIFAKSLSKGQSVLGFAFQKQGTSQGVLPPPLLTVDPDLAKRLLVPERQTYIGNIEVLQKAAAGVAFINATPDADGIVRFSPLILRKENLIYPCLALEAARLYLQFKDVRLMTSSYGDSIAVEGVVVDDLKIPTDAWGRILIPFRGPPYSFPYISASSVLRGEVPKEKIQGKLVFIGSSALATGDLLATAIAPAFAGVEVHATIASGIIDRYLPYRPTWSKGVSVVLVLVLGLFFAICLPFLGIIGSTLVYLPFPFLLIGFNRWIWIHYGIVLSMTAPILTVTTLYILNLLCGYLFEVRKRKQMRMIFDQYIPPERIDLLMSQQKGQWGLDGESKELSVLFADIRDFTSLAEKLPASELKDLLNFYFTPMTQVIFNHKGTIDKYVGDLIMAFWGAPLEDPNHAYNAVSAALGMQSVLSDMNEILRKEGKKTLQIGIGINTGTMSVGDMGSRFRRAYTVLGDAVNLGARLESSTKYYRIGLIVGEGTYAQTKDAFIYRKLDRVRVKGKQTAVLIYEPLDFMEEGKKERWRFLELHEKAMEAYFLQKWEEARSLFAQLKVQDPTSQEFYTLYLNRIDQLKTLPLPADWDGVYQMETK